MSRVPELAARFASQFDPNVVRLASFGNGVDEPLPRLPGVDQWDSPTRRWWSGGWNWFIQAIRERLSGVEGIDAVWCCNDDAEGLSVEMGDELYRWTVGSTYFGKVAAISPAVQPCAHVSMAALRRGVREVRYIDGTCPMILVDAWDHVGGFDAAELPGYGADIDWCVRARRNGWKLLVDDRLVVRHEHAGTTRDRTPGANNAMVNNPWREILQRRYEVADWASLTV